MNGLPIADQRLDSFGDDSLGLYRAALAPDPDPVARRDTLLRRQLLADFHEELGLQDRVDLAVLRPVVEMLGQAIGRRRVGELRCVPEALPIVGEHAGDRIAPDLRRIEVDPRRLERLVMHRERSIAHQGARVDARRAFLRQDEGSDPLGRWDVDAVVRHVEADPLRPVPLDQLALLVPRLAVHVRRSAIVHDAAIGRPREGPTGRDAGIARIGGVTARHDVAAFRELPGIDPVAARRRTIVLKLGEGVELATGRDRLGRIERILDRGQRVTVHLLGELERRRFLRVEVGPVGVEDRVGERAAFLLVQLAHAGEHAADDVDVRPRLPRRVLGRLVPLQPAGGIGQ